MLWQDKKDSGRYIVPDDVVDLTFQIKCTELPVDHAWALANEIKSILPWFEDEPCAAVQPVHVAASGNGWTRPPAQQGSLLQLSRRTKLQLRLPNHRCTDVEALCGSRLNIAGHDMQIGNFQKKKLVPATTIFSRSVCCSELCDEDSFGSWVAKSLESRDIEVAKMLCGLSHEIQTGGRVLEARSLLLTDLDLPQSIQLQQVGVGTERTMGCGLFLPHKSLAAVGSSQEED